MSRAFIAALLACGLSASSPARAAEDGRTRVVVMDVRAVGGLDPKTVEALSSLLASEVARRRDLRVISGADIRTVIGLERQRALLGCSDATCFAEIGGALGARFVVSSELGAFGSSLLLTVALIDAGSGQTIGRTTRRGPNADAILEQSEPAVHEVLANLPTPKATAAPPPIAPPPPIAAAPPAPEPAPEPVPVPPAAIEPAPAPTGPSSVPGWTSIGLGGVAMLGGALLEVSAWSHAGESVTQAQTDSIERDAMLGGIGLAAGAALVGVGIWLLPDAADEGGAP